MARSLAAKSSSPARRSPSPSPSPQPHAAGSKSKTKAAKRKLDYTSEGVADNDVFLLPVSDYQVMIVVTLVAAAVRLFRIYQPTSVVFDEVQCVPSPINSCPNKRIRVLTMTLQQLRWFCFQVHQRPLLHGCSPPARETDDHPLRLAGWI